MENKDNLEGKIVILKHMDDIQAPKPGTRGRIIGVDDIGQIHVIWESGGRLALVPGVDEYEIIK